MARRAAEAAHTIMGRKSGDHLPTWCRPAAVPRFARLLLWRGNLERVGRRRYCDEHSTGPEFGALVTAEVRAG